MPAPTAISHYSIERELGRGAMGVVYLARDGRLDRLVAIKALPETLLSDGAWRARMEREARILASMNHPNVATIYGLEKLDGAAYLVLELADGQTLSEMMPPAGTDEASGLDLPTALRIAIQIASGVGAAHERGVIHRDLKPANVKVRTDGLVKVLDFGIAKSGLVLGAPDAATIAADPPERPVSSFGAAMVGTPGYFSPEQARGKAVSRSTDLWAFGSVLFEMLTGRKACPGETLADIVVSTLVGEPEYDALPRQTPRAVRDLLRRCMIKDPHERLDSFAEARAALEQALDESLGGHIVASVSATAADPAPSNIPDEETRLVSRTTEVHGVLQELQAGPIVTVMGQPGSGKSRVAQRAARAWCETEDGHAWWIHVPEAASTEFLERLVALAAGARIDGSPSVPHALARLLGKRPALLVLDGCDAARIAAAEAAASLIRAAPSLRMLATSRLPLGAAGERFVSLFGLEAPPPDGRGRFAAAAFFVHRASQSPGGFEASSDNAPGVARLCQSLAGLPLAIELVAARAGGQPFDRFHQRVMHRLNLGMNSGVGSLEERALRAAVDWAIEQTLHTHRKLLQQLSLLSGWFDARAAAAFTSPPTGTDANLDVSGPYRQQQWDVLRLLANLADRSLVIARQTGEGGASQHWFKVPSAVREAAAAGLALHGGPAEPARLIVRYAALLAEQSAGRFTRADGPLWLQTFQDRLGLFYDALRLAHQHGAEGEEERLRSSLERFWNAQGL